MSSFSIHRLRCTVSSLCYALRCETSLTPLVVLFSPSPSLALPCFTLFVSKQKPEDKSNGYQSHSTSHCQQHNKSCFCNDVVLSRCCNTHTWHACILSSPLWIGEASCLSRSLSPFLNPSRDLCTLTCLLGTGCFDRAVGRYCKRSGMWASQSR